ncbi:YaaA family protein [Actinomadura atramentaria]|uniref:YaaA family protein n=1 Tax=Actinomadura atramentaria TaxID=1990 RepID=UPI00036F8BA6|nr:peroxide stress protein YaaA [Actinomadura atramentaria]
MLILLPPSEKKAADGDGPPLDLAALAFPELNPVRERVMAALAAVCRRPGAAGVLGLSAGQAAEAADRARALTTAPTLPAAKLYTGVLYDHLALDTLDAERAAERIVVFSGLWGALRLADRVPPYRLAMNAALPPLGRLAALWRPALAAALRPDGLVVDLRSGPYAAAWRAPAPAVAVRVLRERVVGGEVQRTVVSHMAKATRGAIAHDLIASGADPRTPDELLKAVAGLGHTAELHGDRLDVVLAD